MTGRGSGEKVKERTYTRPFLVSSPDISVTSHSPAVIHRGLLAFNGVNSAMWLYPWLGTMSRYPWTSPLTGMTFWPYKKKEKKERILYEISSFAQDKRGRGTCMIDPSIIAFLPVLP